MKLANQPTNQPTNHHSLTS